MRPSTGLTRFFWRLTALLQILLPPFVAVADARLERDALSAGAYSHVESKTGKNCAPVHTPDCALCQHLSKWLGKPGKPPALTSVVRPDSPQDERTHAPIALAVDRPSLPRAPPAA